MNGGPVQGRGDFSSAHVGFHQFDEASREIGSREAEIEIKAQGGSRFLVDYSGSKLPKTRRSSESDMEGLDRKDKSKKISRKLRSFLGKGRMASNRLDRSLSAPDLFTGTRYTFGEEVFKEFEAARSKLLVMMRDKGLKLDSDAMVEAYMKEGLRRGLIAGHERVFSVRERDLSAVVDSPDLNELDFSLKKSGKDAFSAGYMEGFKRGFKKEQV